MILKDARFTISPFHRACFLGEREKVLSLLADGTTNPNQKTASGITPFMLACLMGREEVVLALLEHPLIEVNQENEEEGDTAFLLVCKQGNIRMVQILAGSQRVDIRKGNSFATPYYYACLKGHHDIVRFLTFVAGISPNEPNIESETPLWIAAKMGHISIVELILAGTRDPATRIQSQCWSTSATGEAIKRNFLKIAELIENFERNPFGLRLQLRRKLGLDGNLFFFFFFFLLGECKCHRKNAEGHQ